MHPIPALDLAAQRQRLGGAVEQAIARVMEHGRFIMGPEVGQLEEELASFCGAGHAVGCASGTDALLLALLAWGIGPGDAVFVPAFTFVATAEAVALVGATPVFVDVDARHYNVDAQSLRDAVASVAEGERLRPAVVVPVDLFGRAADYDAISSVAGEYGLRVLADGAQSFGGTVGARRVGTLADATATSFFPSKPLGCYGDGGALFTDDPDVAAAVRVLRVHGSSDRSQFTRVGTNSRLDTVQAAVLLAKLPLFHEELAARRRLAQRYSDALAAVVDVPPPDDDVTSAWAQYTVQVDDRDGLAAALAAGGIASAVYYRTPVHRQPAYEGFPRAPGGLATSERLADRVISLPLHPYLTDEDQDRVIDAVANFLVRDVDFGGSPSIRG